MQRLKAKILKNMLKCGRGYYPSQPGGLVLDIAGFISEKPEAEWDYWIDLYEIGCQEFKQYAGNMQNWKRVFSDVSILLGETKKAPVDGAMSLTDLKKQVKEREDTDAGAKADKVAEAERLAAYDKVMAAAGDSAPSGEIDLNEEEKTEEKALAKRQELAEKIHSEATNEKPKRKKAKS